HAEDGIRYFHVTGVQTCALPILLAKVGGGNSLMAAAGVIGSGILVEPPRTSILTISFQHPDKDLVQPVMDTLIKCYMDKHNQVRSEEHTSELQSRENLVCRLLLE